MHHCTRKEADADPVTYILSFRERISHTPPQSSNKAEPTVETQRRRHQKSETGVSVALKVDMCPTKI